MKTIRLTFGAIAVAGAIALALFPVTKANAFTPQNVSPGTAGCSITGTCTNMGVNVCIASGVTYYRVVLGTCNTPCVGNYLDVE